MNHKMRIIWKVQWIYFCRCSQLEARNNQWHYNKYHNYSEANYRAWDTLMLATWRSLLEIFLDQINSSQEDLDIKKELLLNTLRGKKLQKHPNTIFSKTLKKLEIILLINQKTSSIRKKDHLTGDDGMVNGLKWWDMGSISK